MPPLTLGEASLSRRNNFDFLRFLLASLVILTHSFHLLHKEGEPWRSSPMTRSIWAYWRSIFFFVISGFLIANSWQHSKAALDYLKKRILRIYPGYICAVLFTVFVVGLIGASGPSAYLHSLPIKKLFIDILRLHTIVPLPTFLHNPDPGELNGSLWSIAIEFECYPPDHGDRRAQSLAAARMDIGALHDRCPAEYRRALPGARSAPNQRPYSAGSGRETACHHLFPVGNDHVSLSGQDPPVAPALRNLSGRTDLHGRDDGIDRGVDDIRRLCALLCRLQPEGQTERLGAKKPTSRMASTCMPGPSSSSSSSTWANLSIPTNSPSLHCCSPACAPPSVGSVSSARFCASKIPECVKKRNWPLGQNRLSDPFTPFWRLNRSTGRKFFRFSVLA